MKNLKFYFIALALLFCAATFAQVKIDHQLQMTGTGTNAEITGIKTVANGQDAVNDSSVQRDILKYALATGSGSSGNPYAVNLTPGILTAYTTGMVVYFMAQSACIAGPVYITVNGLPAKTIKKNGTSADLAAGDIAVNQAVAVIYDGTYFQMLSQLGNSSGSSVSHGKESFGYIGANQYFTVPSGVTLLTVKLWGAGGASGGTGGGKASTGGGGAFINGILTVTPGQVLTIIVGQGGQIASQSAPWQSNTFGGGGVGGDDKGGNGGGRSAIQIISGIDTVTAGGGGGAGQAVSNYYGCGGGGGAPNGSNGINGISPTDGTCTGGEGGGGGNNTTHTGTGGGWCTNGGGSPIDDGGNGTQYTGGDGAFDSGTQGSGGGGGGYYGGGSGGLWNGGGGGGGSSYPSSSGNGFTLSSNIAGQSIAGGSPGPAIAGGNTDSDYPVGGSIGIGGYNGEIYSVPYNGYINDNNGNGGNGYIVISW